MIETDFIIDRKDRILVTGASGFIGTRVVDTLLQRGFRNLVCLARPSGRDTPLRQVIEGAENARIELHTGNLLSAEDCDRITDGVAVIYHLAAARGVKSYPDAFLNSVVSTRNLLDAVARRKGLRRFVGVSSFTVYSNVNMRRGSILDETCEIDSQPALRGEAYCYAKVKQEDLIVRFCGERGIPFVLVRPATVFGPGNRGLPGRVGVDILGLFFHLGGSNRIPFTYVDNCAEAIVLAGLKQGIDGQAFNVVDDELPTSREFLRMYKQQVRRFRSIPVPRPVSHLLCWLWERYSIRSSGQLPPVYNTRRWSNDWKGNRYSNEKAKARLGWEPRVPFAEAARRFFEYERTSKT